MALGNRYKTAPVRHPGRADPGPVLGSPWLRDWVNDNTDPETRGRLVAALLAWPAGASTRTTHCATLIVQDLRAILVVVLTLVFPTAARLANLPGARTISQFSPGWAAYVFAGGFAALSPRCSWPTRHCSVRSGRR